MSEEASLLSLIYEFLGSNGATKSQHSLKKEMKMTTIEPIDQDLLSIFETYQKHHLPSSTPKTPDVKATEKASKKRKTKPQPDESDPPQKKRKLNVPAQPDLYKTSNTKEVLLNEASKRTSFEFKLAKVSPKDSFFVADFPQGPPPPAVVQRKPDLFSSKRGKELRFKEGNVSWEGFTEPHPSNYFIGIHHLKSGIVELVPAPFIHFQQHIEGQGSTLDEKSDEEPAQKSFKENKIQTYKEFGSKSMTLHTENTLKTDLTTRNQSLFVSFMPRSK